MKLDNYIEPIALTLGKVTMNETDTVRRIIKDCKSVDRAIMFLEIMAILHVDYQSAKRYIEMSINNGATDLHDQLKATTIGKFFDLKTAFRSLVHVVKQQFKRGRS